MSSYGNATTVGSSSSPSDVRNSLEDYETTDYEASLIAWRYCPPLILLLGTLGNVMILRVVGMSSSSSSSSSSMSVSFRALAVSDLILLYTDLIRNWIKYMFHLEIRHTHSAFCKIHVFLVYVTSMTSAWFLAMMTTQRAILVVWPHQMRQLHSRKAASLAIAVIVAVGCLLHSHHLYGHEVRYFPDYGRSYCDYLNPEYERFARGPWPWMDICMSALLPFSLLLTSNSLLIWKVTSSVRDVRKLTSAGPQAVSQRQKLSTSLNVTLVLLSAMFFMLTSPGYLFMILDYYLNFDLVGSGEGLRLPGAKLGWAVTNLLWYCNSAVNFYVYFLTGSRFREEVRQCLYCIMPTQRKK